MNPELDCEFRSGFVDSGMCGLVSFSGMVEETGVMVL